MPLVWRLDPGVGGGFRSAAGAVRELGGWVRAGRGDLRFFEDRILKGGGPVLDEADRSLSAGQRAGAPSRLTCPCGSRNRNVNDEPLVNWPSLSSDASCQARMMLAT